jgi:long-chain-alcohol oxidase
MGTAHIMGSCRMNVDESRGAANPHGELYGIENLFIGDASVFPTAPGVNPMVTIMSMARRTAESIKTKLRGS